MECIVPVASSSVDTVFLTSSDTKQYTLLENVKVDPAPTDSLLLLSYMYRDSRLSEADATKLEQFIYGNRDPTHPRELLFLSESIEEDRDNFVFVRVRRYIELCHGPRAINLKKTAVILNQEPKLLINKCYFN